MGAHLEAIQTVQSPEAINRRTDDILFNVRYLQANIQSYEGDGTFAPGVEIDVLEQDITEIAEADVHRYAPIVYQERDDHSEQYISLGVGSYDNAKNGYEAIDAEDEISWFELGRRLEEVIDEAVPLDPIKNRAMRSGAIKLMISPEPTHHEADPDVATSFGYDGRTMFRLQRLSPDGKTKTMQSLSIFNVHASVWARYLGDKLQTDIDPTALEVMRVCNDILLDAAETEDVLQEFIGGVIAYVDDEDKENVERQLEGFLTEQENLHEQTDYYAREKLALEKELALSYGRKARPAVLNVLSDVAEHLNKDDKQALQSRYRNGELYVDDYIAELVIKIKTLTTDNRAGLATLNQYTVQRMASRIGLEATLELVARERLIQLNVGENVYNDFMIRESEQAIAGSGAGCGGGCSVSVLGLFSEGVVDAAKAGVTGTLYNNKELDKGSKCRCVKENKKAKVLSNGKNVVCVSCGDFEVDGKRGNVKKPAGKS